MRSVEIPIMREEQGADRGLQGPRLSLDPHGDIAWEHARERPDLWRGYRKGVRFWKERYGQKLANELKVARFERRWKRSAASPRRGALRST